MEKVGWIECHSHVLLFVSFRGFFPDTSNIYTSLMSHSSPHRTIQNIIFLLHSHSIKYKEVKQADYTTHTTFKVQLSNFGHKMKQQKLYFFEHSRNDFIALYWTFNLFCGYFLLENAQYGHFRLHDGNNWRKQ